MTAVAEILAVVAAEEPTIPTLKIPTPRTPTHRILTRSKTMETIRLRKVIFTTANLRVATHVGRAAEGRPVEEGGHMPTILTLITSGAGIVTIPQRLRLPDEVVWNWTEALSALK